jgi:hypothetical protein
VGVVVWSNYRLTLCSAWKVGFGPLRLVPCRFPHSIDSGSCVHVVEERRRSASRPSGHAVVAEDGRHSPCTHDLPGEAVIARPSKKLLGFSKLRKS